MSELSPLCAAKRILIWRPDWSAAGSGLVKIVEASRPPACSGARKQQTMSLSCIRMKPVSWTQEIRSNLDLRYKPGRNLRAVCKPDDFKLSDGTNLIDHSVELYFGEGEPTAANDKPLEKGIGKLFCTREAFIHGWYFSPTNIHSDIWDQVLNGGYTDCMIELAVEPINYDSGDDPVWDISQPLFIDSAIVYFTRKSSAPDEETQSKRQRLFRWRG
jgi:hypothetical protein